MSIFLKACRREPVPYTPIWLMRQAGRYMKDYRAIREKMSFIELCKNKDLAAEITVRAQSVIKADAAIIFSDILLMVEPLGLRLDYVKNEGPLIRKTIRSVEDVDRIPEIDPSESLSFVMDAIRSAKKSLKSDIALIGFAGAPFTLASYMIEGGPSNDFAATKKFMQTKPGAWKGLLQKLARATSKYLDAQVQAGADAIQIFDSWVGCLTSVEYEKYALPYTSQVIKGLQTQAPVIHFGTNTGSFLEKMAMAGAGIVAVDHRVDLDQAWKRIGTDNVIQGNLDPRIVCGPIDRMKKQVEIILKQAAGRPGHIFNLGHGVLPETPLENVIALVEMVHSMSRKEALHV